MIQTNLPVKKEKLLIEIPEYNPKVGFLGGKQGEEINKEIQSKYEKIPFLQRPSYSDGVIKGSNPFYVVAVNEIIKPQGLRTATLAELEKVLKTGALDLKGYDEDPALVLRSGDDPNTYLAEDLIKQIKEKTGKERKTPIMIPLAGLKLRVDQDSEHGLAFNLTDDSEIIYAPQMNHKDHDKKFLKTNVKGLPIFNKNGTRTFYTRDSGLSRLCLEYTLDLDSYSDNLTDTTGRGRVVVVSDEVTSSEKLKSDLIDEINKKYNAQLEELNSRKTEAEKAVQRIMNR